MKLLLFYFIATVTYCAGIVFLVNEYNASSAERRKELETGPLILASTLLYVVAVLKTQQLVAMFAMA